MSKFTGVVFYEKFLHNFFDLKMAKAALLLGLVFLGGYELFNFNNQAKLRPQQPLEETSIKSANNIDKNTDFDFIEF